MVVGSAGNQAKAMADQRRSQSLGIANNLLLVSFEFAGQGFLQGHRLRGDDMHQRSPLKTGENLSINGLGVLGARENHSPPGSAQGFMGRGRNKIRIRN